MKTRILPRTVAAVLSMAGMGGPSVRAFSTGSNAAYDIIPGFYIRNPGMSVDTWGQSQACRKLVRKNRMRAIRAGRSR